MSTFLSAEISATCNALGYLDEKNKKYYADSNTLETVKDLIRYLRRDDDNHSIRRQLGSTKVLQTDLLPLLKYYHSENDLFDVLLRLIMNLTTPPLLLFNFEIPKDKSLRNLYLEMEDHLQSYKEAFVDDGIWAVFSTQLSKILELDHGDRGEENSVKIERILVLIRNVLFVPSDAVEKRPDNDASIHDQVLWALHHSGLLDIILYITTNPMEQGYYMYILEIMFFMLRNQQPDELANAALERSQSEKLRDEAELINIRNIEQTQKQSKMKKYSGSRHSRFGGTYVVKSVKSISELDLISHKALNKLDTLDFDSGKRKKKTPKNKVPLTSNAVERKSAFTIRLFLKEFCIEFLNGAYNTMMQYVKGILVRSGGDMHDESYYFWGMSFFMAFNRNYKFEIKLVSETLSVQSFHYVQQQSENYFDLIKTDRRKFVVWSRRLHKALLGYKELFMTLLFMDKSEDSVRESSKVIKSNIFYIPEYREFILTLLINYNELTMSDLYLKDLMETQHLFLKMFESFCQQEGSIVVQKKSKKKNKTKKKSQPRNQELLEEKLTKMWDKASPQLSTVLESGGEFLTEEVPFDAASDVPIDEQKVGAMKKIQSILRNSEYEKGISLMRAAREVWPENNSFGSENMTTEEEFLALREIFFTDFGDEIIQNTESVENNEDEEGEQEEHVTTHSREVHFDFKEIVNRLCNPKIVRACGIALRGFKTNSITTNHAILKLMHRIAFDAKNYVMLFQLSLFRTFQQIFILKDHPQYRELVKFAIFIMRKFTEVAAKNDRVFVEALFWKSRREAYEIEVGYGTYEASASGKAKKAMWSEEEELELMKLFKEYNEDKISEDVVDWILKNLINQNRNRRMVLKKLREMDLIDNYKQKSKFNMVSHKINWSPEEELQLSELYDQYKNSSDPVGLIMANLDLKRPKNRIIEKMITLGLIEDRKQVRKKRNKKSGGGGTFDSDSDESNSGLPVNRRKKKSTLNKINKVEIIKLYVENLNAGRRQGLEWLKDSFSDAIEDFEDNDEGVPLVTLSEELEGYMENSEFQALIKAFGISEPFDEQEKYWRIPGNMGVDILKSNCDLLTILLSTENPSSILEEETKKSKKKQKGQAKSKPVQKHFGPDFLPTTSDSSDSDDDKPNRLKPNNIQTSLKKTTSYKIDKNKISNLFRKNFIAGRREGLEWLKENFYDAIEDFDDDSESIPLVTLSEDIENYMENSEFQGLLKACGITEPFDEQEKYWRIPEHFGLDILKSHYELLTSLLNEENSNISSDSDEDKPSRLEPNNIQSSLKKETSYKVDKNKISELFRKNLIAGRREGLEWLKENFYDAIQDFDDDSDSIPLVTLSGDIKSYMDNSGFQALLKACGITEPLDEQEKYWRIPEKCGLDFLKSHYELLTSLLNEDNSNSSQSAIRNAENEIHNYSENEIYNSDNEIQKSKNETVRKRFVPDFLSSDSDSNDESSRPQSSNIDNGKTDEKLCEENESSATENNENSKNKDQNSDEEKMEDTDDENKINVSSKRSRILSDSSSQPSPPRKRNRILDEDSD